MNKEHMKRSNSMEKSSVGHPASMLSLNDSELSSMKAEELLDYYLRVSPDDKSELKLDIKSQFQLILTALRRRQIQGSYSCTKATMEILRKVLGHGRFATADQMMRVVRVIGKELALAAPCEFTIGNLVRRVLFMIREEHIQKVRLSAKVLGSAMASSVVAGSIGGTTTSSNTNISNSTTRQRPSLTGSESQHTSRRDRSGTSTSQDSNERQPIDKQIQSTNPSSPNRPRTHSGQASSGQTASGSTTVPPIATVLTSTQVTDSDYLASLIAAVDASNGQEKQNAFIGGNVLGSVALNSKAENIDFSRQFSDMRTSVMTAVNELNDELEAIYGPIAELAQDHIHSDECILTYGHSNFVEIFLKAAGKKRKYQVIIAEDAPSLEGHKLALNLSKIPNISVSLIPDAAIYAIMSRINKVIFSPEAVMADGGAIARCGHALVTTAAKEFSVPVLGLTGGFLLTPLFAHNQSEVLGTLVSPALGIPYHTPMDSKNVELMMPAYDYISPEFIELYVTNNGCHLPSYVYRLLPEYYHPDDYTL